MSERLLAAICCDCKQVLPGLLKWSESRHETEVDGSSELAIIAHKHHIDKNHYDCNHFDLFYPFDIDEGYPKPDVQVSGHLVTSKSTRVFLTFIDE